MMLPKKPEEYDSNGKLIFIYGESGVGKSTSIFATAPEPLCYVDTENRNPLSSIKACGRPDVKVDLYDYSNWPEIMDFLDHVQFLSKYKSIILDSATHLMNIQLSGELEDESFTSRNEEDQLVKPLISSVKLSMEGYGAISTQMVRLFKKLSILRKAGHTVIVTALLDQNPRWDKALAAGPALKGREFPALLPGFCDMIGMIKHNVDKDNKIVYPPLVYFESPDQSFMAKYTGVRPEGVSSMVGPLNFTTILSL